MTRTSATQTVNGLSKTVMFNYDASVEPKFAFLFPIISSFFHCHKISLPWKAAKNFGNVTTNLNSSQFFARDRARFERNANA